MFLLFYAILIGPLIAFNFSFIESNDQIGIVAVSCANFTGSEIYSLVRICWYGILHDEALA